MHIFIKLAFIYLVMYVGKTRVFQLVTLLLPVLSLYDGLRTMVLYFCKTKTKNQQK